MKSIKRITTTLISIAFAGLFATSAQAQTQAQTQTQAEAEAEAEAEAKAKAQTPNTASSKAQERGAYGVLSATSYDLESFGAEAKLGYNFNKYFGVEAQIGAGLTEDAGPIADFPNAATLTLKVDHTVGAFGVARLPLTKQFEVFAIAGIHQTQYNVKISNVLGTDYDVNNTGFAGGGGIQYNLSPKSAIRAEYTYLDKSGINTTSIGYVRKF